jgi:hypothetical protein
MTRRPAAASNVLTADAPSRADRRLRDLIRFWGVPGLWWRPGPGGLQRALATVAPGELHLATTAAALHRVLAAEADPAAAAALLRRHLGSLLLIGLGPGRLANEVLPWITGLPGAACEAPTGRAARLTVTAMRPDVTGALGGAETDLAAPVMATAAVLGGLDTPGAEPVLSLDGAPLSVVLENDQRPFHLVASADVVDLDEPTGRGFELATWLPWFAPTRMYLQHVFGSRVWHAPAPRAALIVDDPGIRPRHGFLRVEPLIADMEQRNYATTIGFIPLNAGRSQAEIAPLFRNHEERLSLCVHGCDHTRHEFGDPDPGHLHLLARIAMARMRRLEQTAGVPFSPIMVFPHGVFNGEALQALRGNGYIAGVNSHIHPRGPRDAATRIRDHLTLALVADAAAPVFQRKPAQGPVVNFQVQAFLGQPLLAGAHHDICRDGMRPLHDHVARVRDMVPGVQWASLARTIRRSYLQRDRRDGRRECLLFSDETDLENPDDERREYVLILRDAPGQPVPRILVDGEPRRARARAGVVRLELTLAAGAGARIVVQRGDPSASPARDDGDEAGFSRSALVRRYACDFWDDLLSHDVGLLTPLVALKKRYSRDRGGG